MNKYIYALCALVFIALFSLFVVFKHTENTRFSVSPPKKDEALASATPSEESVKPSSPTKETSKSETMVPPLATSKQEVAKELSDQKKTVCLNMIVKDETKVITRCLATVKPIIDYWVIVDTGSTDGTQDLIKEFMKDIPGELHEQPWKNFEHNRNGALELAKGKADYILFIDADEVLAFDSNFKMPVLDKDFYYIMTDFSGTNYYRNQLIKGELDWKWAGVLHEVLVSKQAKTNGILEGVRNVVRTDGARSTDPKKFQKDIKVLQEALEKEPNSTRYTFYLAQSYKDAGEHEKAIEVYEKRIAMGGWDQEVFWSMLQKAILEELTGKPPEVFINSYYQAYQYRPTRVEPLYRLANYYRRTGNYAPGYLIAMLAQRIPPSKDILFVEKWIYDYGIPIEASVCAYWIGKYEECQAISKQLLAKPDLAENVRTTVEQNLAFANKKLLELYVNMNPLQTKQFQVTVQPKKD